MIYLQNHLQQLSGNKRNFIIKAVRKDVFGRLFYCLRAMSLITEAFIYKTEGLIPENEAFGYSLFR